MKRAIAGACAAALLVVAGGVAEAQSRRSQEAQESGVASIHAWVKVGRKTCMLDHYHDGNGNGRTRKEAERAAVNAWSEFTAWEYGTPWARYAIAESRQTTCTPQSKDAWSCAVQARPCRPY